MQTTLVTIHIIVTLCLIGVILLQRVNSDGLQGISSSSGMGGVMSPASSASFMNKLTYGLAAIFLINCLILSNLAMRDSQKSITDQIKTNIQTERAVNKAGPPIAE